jgi:hypothetical protein
MSNGVEKDVQSQVPSAPSVPSNEEGEEDDGKTETAEGTVNPEEDDGEEVVPVGSVNAEGEVIDREGNVVGKVEGEIPEGSLVDTEGDVLDTEGNVIGKADVSQAAEGAEDAVGERAEGAPSVPEGGEATEGAPSVPEVGEKVEGAPSALEVEKPELAGPFGVQDNGEVTNATGVPIGHLAEGDPVDLVGRSIKDIDSEGNLKATSGSILGKVELNTEGLGEGEPALDEAGEKLPTNASVKDAVPETVGGSQAKLPTDAGVTDAASKVPEEGQEALGEVDEKAPTEAGATDAVPEAPTDVDVGEAAPALDFSILKGLKVNKLGKIVDENGVPVGQLIEGDPKKLAGKKVDEEGKIWNDAGKVIGQAEPFPEKDDAPLSAPFEDFPDAVIDAKGNVLFEGRIVGKVVEGDAKKLEGKKVDADGDILDKHGNTLGKAERYQEEEAIPEVPEVEDLSDLEGKKVNKAGNVVDDHGKLFGRIVEGDLSKLIGKKCDAEGKIWSESGKVIGRAELIPMDDRDAATGGPFEDFPGSIVDSKGNILFQGQIVGKLIEGDAKKLTGKKIDKDGEIVDSIGNVLGKAERWIEPDEPEPEAIDMSALAGKRVNKLGNLVDSHGQIFGRLIEGDAKKLAGKMCDKNGNIRNEMGDIIGKAELVPESEREGQKTGPFADFENPTVIKDGKVADERGVIIGRLVAGDAKLLFGKPVDSDGDILDKNGNTLGRAERWEEEEKEVEKHPAAGRKVNRKGEVMDEAGDIIAKLTEGEITKCAGKSIDNDGDVVDSKGKAIGHVTLLEDIPEPEPEPEPEPVVEEPKESEEEIEARKQAAQDKKLAGQLASCIEQSIDKIKPILKMITDAIDAAERQPKEDLDEQKLVDTVKPLLEEGGQILQECNGAVRALDPDGRIQTNAKHKSASRDASPEEYHLAEQLKELASTVMTAIDSAKKKIAGMPHAKKELNPLWNLLAEPLGQIIAAVGLLLSGVLGLVGRLLSGLGLGGLLDNLLGGLGIKGILEGLGLGMVTKSLTGKK